MSDYVTVQSNAILKLNNILMRFFNFVYKTKKIKFHTYIFIYFIF